MSIYGISFKNNPEQAELVRLIMAHQYQIVFGLGKAGTGKNFAALACALHLKSEKEYGDVYYARNPVECGEKMGYLPGGEDEKYSPYMMPLQDTIQSIVRHSAFYQKSNRGQIKSAVEMALSDVICLPIFNIRGRTIDDAIVIIDECQNLDAATLRTLMTRIGPNAKLVLLGSWNQIDAPEQQRRAKKYGKCDFQRVAEWFTENRPEYCGSVELIQSMRNPVCVDIDESFDQIFADAN